MGSTDYEIELSKGKLSKKWANRVADYLENVESLKDVRVVIDGTDSRRVCARFSLFGFKGEIEIRSGPDNA